MSSWLSSSSENARTTTSWLAEKGRNGIVRVGKAVVTKAEYGGAFRKPTFTVIRIQHIYGVTYDQSVGAEEVKLHTSYGNVTWNIYGANVFTLATVRGAHWRR